MDDRADLLVCPFCGGTNARDHEDDFGCSIICRDCLSEGPILQSAGEAMVAWNRRIPLPPPATDHIADAGKKVATEPGLSREAWAAGRIAGLEEAQAASDAIASKHWDDYKGSHLGPHPRPTRQGSPYAEGGSDGAEECAAAIEKLKGAP